MRVTHRIELIEEASRSRRPRDRQCYQTWTSVAKCFTVAVITLLLGGCRDATRHSAVNHGETSTSNGQFVVPQADLPSQIVELARAFERLPTISTDTEFRSTLARCGLNKEPDHFKDFGHFWYLDETFQSETDPKKRAYLISIGHFPAANSRIVFYYASIDRVFPTEPWRETLWKIDWPIEPVN